MTPRLLDRDAFRVATFARSGGRCVACARPAVDAHHLVERRLFRLARERGGYFLDNGVAVCAPCHLAAETTELSVEALRLAAGIACAVMPACLDPDLPCDKWGNPLLADGRRLRGPLFHEEPVRRALAGRERLFLPHAALPRDLPGDPRPPSGATLALALPDGAVAAVDAGAEAGPGLEAWGSVASELPPGWRLLGAIGPDGPVAIEVWDETDVSLSAAEAATWMDLLGVVPAGPGCGPGGCLLRPEEAVPFHVRRDRVARLAAVDNPAPGA